MTFTEAAAQVLRLVGKPLHYKEITDVAIERNLLSHVGKSPEVTMGARLAALVKKADKDNPLVRLKPGVFALREWDEETIEKGLADRTPALQLAAERLDQEGAAVATSDEGADGEAPSQEAARAPASRALASHKELGERAEPTDEEERHRAALSAAATGLFEQEEDDDQPIFGAAEEETEAEADDKREGRRRRRRRRGRGKRDEELAESEDDEDLPSYTVSDAPAELDELVERAAAEERTPAVEQALRAERPERDRERPERDLDVEGGPAELGHGLADLVARVLGGFDRSRGPVSLQNVADAVRRKVRANGDLPLHAGAIAASVAADNLRAEREGRCPRFRLSGGRVALTEWTRDRRIETQQRQVEAQLGKLRELVRRSLLETLKALPQRGLGELMLVLLEQSGVEELATVRRPGTHGAELHLRGVARSATGAIPLAIVVRRDGKDIGRERVTELRGALHHYGPATQGWLITTGQVLSGAREEAAVNGAAPVTLTDGAELARLCERFGVGVVPTRVEVPSLDAALFETLQG